MDVLFPNLLKGLFRASSTNKDQEEWIGVVEHGSGIM